MSVLLDTNIVSEIIKPKSEPRVARWLMGQPAGDIFLCAVTEAELRYGLALMPTGRRRDVLAADVQRMLSGVFAGRIWPFDSDARPNTRSSPPPADPPVGPSPFQTLRSPPSPSLGARPWPPETSATSKRAGASSSIPGITRPRPPIQENRERFAGLAARRLKT